MSSLGSWVVYLLYSIDLNISGSIYDNISRCLILDLTYSSVSDLPLYMSYYLAFNYLISLFLNLVSFYVLNIFIILIYLINVYFASKFSSNLLYYDLDWILSMKPYNLDALWPKCTIYGHLTFGSVLYTILGLYQADLGKSLSI